MNRKFVKAIVGASLIGALSIQPASAGWGHHGGGFGFAAAAVIGGIALGALAASQPAYPAYDYAPGCYPAHRPVFDAYGNVVGYQPVCR